MDPKNKIKTKPPQNQYLTNSQIDIKSNLQKNTSLTAQQSKQKPIGINQQSIIMNESKTPKLQTLVSEKGRLTPTPNNQKLSNRGSVNPDNITCLQAKVTKDSIDSVKNNVQNNRINVGSSNAKNNIETKNPTSPKKNEVPKQRLTNDNSLLVKEPRMFEQKKLPEMRKNSSQNFSNIGNNKDATKQNTLSKSFIDKDNLSATQNSQNEQKKDSINVQREDPLKLTQRSHDLGYQRIKDDGLKNSFVMNNQDEQDHSKISAEVLHSIKQVLDDMKKSINEDAGSASNESEEREILALEEKINRLRAKLINQGFRYFVKWAERKNRNKKREGFKEIKGNFKMNSLKSSN